MIDLGVNISGWKEYNENLQYISVKLGGGKAASILTSAMRVGGKVYLHELENTAPVSKISRLVKTKSGERVLITPGFLKSRIKIKTSTNRRGVINSKFSQNEVSLVQIGVFKVPYIVQVEYGTERVSANPFIRNAFASQTPFAIQKVEQSLKKKLATALKRLPK